MNKNEVIKNFNLNKEECRIIDFFIFELNKTNLYLNLVGKSTMLDPWDRHICDSLQLTQYIKSKYSTILDLGTGAGIPGMILAIIGYKKITMVESKTKKTEFIKKFVVKYGLKTKIVNTRIETLKLKQHNYIICRALAPLGNILNYALFFSNNKTTLVLLKGKNVKKEIIEARKKFSFIYRLCKSKSSGGGFVLIINNFSKK